MNLQYPKIFLYDNKTEDYFQLIILTLPGLVIIVFIYTNIKFLCFNAMGFNSSFLNTSGVHLCKNGFIRMYADKKTPRKKKIKTSFTFFNEPTISYSS